MTQFEVAFEQIKNVSAALEMAKEALRCALVDAARGESIPESMRDIKVAAPLKGPVREWVAFWGNKTVRVVAINAEDAKQLAAPKFRVRRWDTVSVVPAED